MKKFFIFFLGILVVLLSSCSKPATKAVTELELACWVYDLELQEVVDQFNASHDDCQIIVTAYYDKDGNSTAALNRMKTKLLTEQNVDIICLDSLDEMALENAGLLMDLYPLMEKDDSFCADDYYMNIWNLFSKGGKLFEFVNCYQLGCLYGRPELLADRSGWTIDEFCEFRHDLKESTNWDALSISNELMLSMMVQFSMENYIDTTTNECNFDSISFCQWLSFVKGFQNTTNACALGHCWLWGVLSCVNDKVNYGYLPSYVGYPSSYAGGPCAMALCSYGITSYTQHADLCWEFLMSTLSEETQLAVYNDNGFLMNRHAQSTQLKAATLSTANSASILYGQRDQNGDYFNPLTKEEQDRIITMLNQIDNVRFRYYDVLQIIEDEAAAYFSDDKSVEETAALIQNRVSIYLSEKN